MNARQRERIEQAIEQSEKAVQYFTKFASMFLQAIEKQNSMIIDIISGDPNPPAPDVMNYKQASKYLDIPLGTLYQMKSKNRIPYVKLSGSIRFKKIDIDAWIEKNRVSKDVTRRSFYQ